MALPDTVKSPVTVTLPENVANVSVTVSSVLPSQVTVKVPSEPESDTAAVVLPAVSVVDEMFPISVSTKALIDCCVASFVAELEDIVSSSATVPEAKSAKSMFEIELPVPFASKVLFVNVSVVALPTSVSVAAGNVTVTSAVLAGPISVAPLVPLSVPSKNLI